MSCASRRVKGTFMRGCGSSSENASVSGLVANFRAITSNGGASGTSLRWLGATTWHVTHRDSARLCRYRHLRQPLLDDILKKRRSEMLKSNSEQEATRGDFRQILGEFDKHSPCDPGAASNGRAARRSANLAQRRR